MRFLHALLLAAACFAVYANGYEHEYHLDSPHVIRDNPAIRELSWAQVARFFRDPGTSTSLYSNADYRPVLQVVNALNYAWDRSAGPDEEPPAAGVRRQPPGYRTPRWHLVQIVLHLVCVLGLYELARTVLALAAGGDPPRADRGASWIAFLPALVFALHPTGAGVVDYLSARSSLLTAAFLLPALVLHLRTPDEGRRGPGGWLAMALFALALFTKVEAVAGLAPLFLFEVWRTARRSGHERGFVRDLLTTLSRRTAIRLWPFGLAAIVYLVARSRAMTGFDFGEASAATGVSRSDYLVTQTVAWWYYVRNAFAPLTLVADYPSFPVWRSVTEAPVLMAIGGWLLVAGFLLAEWRRRPWLLVLAGSTLALLSPTSSVVVLAEMVNEHRPYLPLAVLSLAWLIPLGQVLVRGPGRVPLRLLGALGLAVVLAGFARATHQRNEVFRTSKGYWWDVLQKAPSFRAHTNYGRELQRLGDYPDAIEHYQASLALAPFWYVTHLNQAICDERPGDRARAREHYDRAVDYDDHSGTALTFRAESHLAHDRWAEALADFRAAAPKSLEPFRLAKGMATASAGLGDAEGCFEQTQRCLELDPGLAEARSFRDLYTPFWRTPNRAAGVDYFRRLAHVLPGAAWIPDNEARLLNLLGRDEEAEAARGRARALGADV